jgi:ribosomal protein L37AE/L43A
MKNLIKSTLIENSNIAQDNTGEVIFELSDSALETFTNDLILKLATHSKDDIKAEEIEIRCPNCSTPAEYNLVLETWECQECEWSGIENHPILDNIVFRAINKEIECIDNKPTGVICNLKYLKSTDEYTLDVYLQENIQKVYIKKNGPGSFDVIVNNKVSFGIVNYNELINELSKAHKHD